VYDNCVILLFYSISFISPTFLYCLCLRNFFFYLATMEFPPFSTAFSLLQNTCSINKLPISTFAQILGHALNDLDTDISVWKSHLQLIAVCSLWRTLGKPLIYSIAFLICKQDTLTSIEAKPKIQEPLISIGTHRSIKIIKFGKCKFQTNLHLLQAVNATHMPSKFKLCTDTTKNIIDVLDVASTIIQYSSVKLYSVTELKIDINIWPFTGEESKHPLKDYKMIINTAISTLAKMVPNVISIESHGSLESPIVDIIANKLAVVYSSRLTRVYSMGALLVSKLEFLNLTSMDIAIGVTSLHYICCIPIETLQNLQLNIYSSDFPWSQLVRDNTSPNIMCPELTRLCVFYNTCSTYDNERETRITYRHKPDRPVFILCPRLKQLCTRMSNNDSVLWSSIPILKKLKYLDVEETIHFLEKLNYVQLPRLDKLRIFPVIRTSDQRQCLESVATINSILSRPILPPQVELDFNLKMDIEHPRATQWSVLTSLRIATFVKPHILAELLPLLPNLVKLYAIVESSTNDVYSKLLDFLNGRTPTPQFSPLSTSLKWLTLIFRLFRDEIEYRAAFGLSKYMLVRTYSLQRAHIAQLNISDLCTFIEMRKMQYPHLDKVKVFKV
ncbi:hypothetical protein BX070DRAFT_258044, partial [Coemansia spiralis]